MVKFFKDLISFIKEDIKTDILFLRRVWRGEERVEGRMRGIFKDFDFKCLLKSYWPFFLLLILSFCCGYLVASQRYEYICAVIVDNITRECTPWLENIRIVNLT